MKAIHNAWLPITSFRQKKVTKNPTEATNIPLSMRLVAVAPMKIPSNKKAVKPAMGIRMAQYL